MKCLFCGKPKERENGFVDWISNLTLSYDYGAIANNLHVQQETFTICPECRKTHTVYQVYEQLVQLQTKKIEKDLAFTPKEFQRKIASVSDKETRTEKSQ